MLRSIESQMATLQVGSLQQSLVLNIFRMHLQQCTFPPTGVLGTSPVHLGIVRQLGDPMIVRVQIQLACFRHQPGATRKVMTRIVLPVMCGANIPQHQVRHLAQTLMFLPLAIGGVALLVQHLTEFTRVSLFLGPPHTVLHSHFMTTAEQQAQTRLS